MRGTDNIGSMPNRRPAKWGEMNSGDSHLSDKWHGMDAGSSPSTDKWNDLDASSPKTSEKWVEQAAGESQFSDRWHDMKQEGREDPYSMFPSAGDRSQPFKKTAKETPNNEKSRATQHTEFGSTREI